MCDLYTHCSQSLYYFIRPYILQPACLVDSEFAFIEGASHSYFDSLQEWIAFDWLSTNIYGIYDILS